MLTEKDYCDYDTCVALKELGYDGYCAAYYHLFDDDEDARNSFEHIYAFDFQNSNNIYRVGAPLLYQAQKWLREEKNIVVRIIPLYEEGKAIKGMSYTNEVIHWDDGYVADECIEEYDSYEEALLEGVRQAIEILKEK